MTLKQQPQSVAAMPRLDPVSELPGLPCSVAAALEVIGGRWAMLAIREVIWGNHRFSEIVRNTGAPRDRMAARLKDLVQAGVLERRQYSDAPPRSDYHLTEAGRALRPVLQALRQWGDTWVVTEPPAVFTHHDHEMRASWVCDTCGERVGSHDVTRRSTVADQDVADLIE